MPDKRAYAAIAAVLLAMPAGAAETSRASLAVGATVAPACSVEVAPTATGGEPQRAAAFCTTGVEPLLTIERGSAGGGALATGASARAERGIVYFTLTY